MSHFIRAIDALVPLTAEGSGLFPLGALVQSDGFFPDAEASRGARNTLPGVRRVRVLVGDREKFARLLRAEGWRLVDNA